MTKILYFRLPSMNVTSCIMVSWDVTSKILPLLFFFFKPISRGNFSIRNALFHSLIPLHRSHILFSEIMFNTEIFQQYSIGFLSLKCTRYEVILTIIAHSASNQREKIENKVSFFKTNASW